ncbi:hypothetical protein ALC60_12173 [Trachymyrmex zeteki]|uniref:Uncharacterized protein n=1 Tax=Mycetomoellerius zeteki TaxID=64791 RepID=A0A151WLD3_9HYME|nr:hypothetical protein ALC60_12173 [Trachymyrmex zeteki]
MQHDRASKDGPCMQLDRNRHITELATLPMQRDDVCGDAAPLHRRNATRIGSGWWNNASLLYAAMHQLCRRRCVSRRSLSRGDTNLGETMREKRITYYCIRTMQHIQTRRALSSCISVICDAINLSKVNILCM